MSDRIDVKPYEKGFIRLFQIDLPAQEAQAFANPPQDEATDWPLQTALGGVALNPAFVQCLRLRDLDELGLAGYLIEGEGVDAKDLITDRAMLDGLKGHVLLVLSSAFAGQSVTLRPQHPLRWIATYQEARAARTGAAPESAAALPYSAPPLPSQKVRTPRPRGALSMILGACLAIVVIVWALL